MKKMKNKVLSLTAALLLTLSISAAGIHQASGTRAETDRTWYLAGETMTVSVTADNAVIAYAELCDTQGLAASITVGLKAGEGKGAIELPADLHSGYYLLSVYTRNNAEVSQQLIAVVNPLRKSVDDDIEWVQVTPPDSLSHAENTSTIHPALSTIPIDIPETEGHIIKARIRNDFDGHTFSASQIRPSLSIVGKQIHYFEGKMINDSTALFFTYGIHGKQPLVLTAMSTTGVRLPVEMVSPFAALLPKQLPHLVFHYNRNEVEARSLDMQRHQKALHPSSSLDYDETVFGIHPDLSYNLDEYRQFLTIREVLLEYVLCVKNTTIDGVPQLIVRKMDDIYNTSLPTLVLIDGMPVGDIERLLNYDARRIHYINIYSDQYTFGNGVYNGILSFVTRSGQLTNYPTEPNMQYLVYDFPE